MYHFYLVIQPTGSVTSHALVDAPSISGANIKIVECIFRRCTTPGDQLEAKSDALLCSVGGLRHSLTTSFFISMVSHVHSRRKLIKLALFSSPPEVLLKSHQTAVLFVGGQPAGVLTDAKRGMTPHLITYKKAEIYSQDMGLRSADFILTSHISFQTQHKSTLNDFFFT